jgi:CHAD domain-containing protein
MTPGLAGFIADSSDQHAWDDTIAAVLAALAAEFDVVPERRAAGAPGGRSRTTWLDTFDWRLYKAGLTLEYVPGRGGSELRLVPAKPDDGNAAAGTATQVVTGWQASRPHPITDLAAGPVSARVAGLAAMRALIPVVATGGTTAAYRLLNSDEKTVARLVVDRSSVIAADAEQPLPPRLTIVEVRGYQGQARRAARLVEAVPGIGPGGVSPLADALRAIGRRPGDYSNKVDADITAAMPAAGVGAIILLRLLDTVEANVDGVLRDIDTEFLHDLRVSVRRTRSALKLLGDALTGLTAAELAFFAAEFKWVGDLTTPTRDLDVHLLDFEDTARGLAAGKPDDLEPFRAYLEQRRRREFRALGRGLRSARFTALTREWRTRLDQIKQDNQAPDGVGRARQGQPARSAGGTAGLLAAERTRVAFVKVAKRGAEITADTPAEALHDLRKRCKELRYALEFFAPLYDPAAAAKVVGDLKRLQDCLGEFQDTEVQIAEIRALAVAMLAANEAPAVTLLAMGEVTAGLAGRQRAARADFERRFAAFADVEGQRRMSALLRGRYRINADLCDIQHQGWRGEDHDGGQPRLPGGRGGAADGPVGPGPAGRRELHVPGQAQGQGGRPRPHQRQTPARRRHQGHRLRQPGPDPGRLHLPEHGPAARPGRREARRPAGRQARQEDLQAPGAALRRVRRGLPRLPAVGLAGLRERAARGRRHRGTAHSDHAVGADA